MKRTVIFLTLVMFAAATMAMAQPFEKKKWEFSTALSFVSFSQSGESSQTVLNIPITVGYFVWKGLEIQPELMLTKFKGDDAAYLVNLNVAYNFLMKKKLVPYVLAGFGLGNGFSYVGVVEGSSDINSTAMNLGAGAKYLVGTAAAFHAELRYTYYHFTETGFPSWNYNTFQLFTGISLFF
jgi:hypothetical protein